MLDHGRDDHVGLVEVQSVDEVVDRLSGVATDDRHVVAAFAAGEVESGLAGLFVARRRQLRLVPRAAMHTRIRRQELNDSIHHRRQRCGGSGGVEPDVASRLPVDAGHETLVADECDGKLHGRHLNALDLR